MIRPSTLVRFKTVKTTPEVTISPLPGSKSIFSTVTLTLTVKFVLPGITGLGFVVAIIVVVGIIVVVDDTIVVDIVVLAVVIVVDDTIVVDIVVLAVVNVVLAAVDVRLGVVDVALTDVLIAKSEQIPTTVEACVHDTPRSALSYHWQNESFETTE